MLLAPVRVESPSDLPDDAREAEEVEARARSRIAELSQRPFDVESIALTGLFVLAVFYTIYFMRSILLPIVLALLLSYLLRPIVRGLAQIKIPLPVSAALLLIGFFGLMATESQCWPHPRRNGSRKPLLVSRNCNASSCR
jgi:hypothetical protein